MRLASPTGCAPCVKINLRGVWPVTQGSLAWPALNRRLRSYWRMADGEFLRAAYPLHMIHRVHQEDVCQAMGLPPTKKYQSDGGPGVREIAELLTTFSTAPVEDIQTFVGAIAFSWLVAGDDAHRKKYTLLLGCEHRIHPSPLFY